MKAEAESGMRDAWRSESAWGRIRAALGAPSSTGESSPMASKMPTAPMIWIFAQVGRASHWSAGPPAAAMSEYMTVGPANEPPEIAFGKT